MNTFLLTKLFNWFRMFHFSPNALPLCQDPIQDTPLPLVALASLHRLLLARHFLRISLFLRTLTVLRRTGEVFCGIPTHRDSPHAFLIWDWGHGFGRKTQRWGTVSITSHHMPPRDLPELKLTFTSWPRRLCQVSLLESSSLPPSPLPFLLSSPAFHRAVFGGSHSPQHTCKEWEAMFHPLRAEYLHKWEICLFYPHSFIYSLIRV